VARLRYASSRKQAMSLRGRKNLPLGSSISSSAGVPAIRDDTNSPSMIDALNARSLGERTPNKLKLVSTKSAAARSQMPAVGAVVFGICSPGCARAASGPRRHAVR
jgi:hypothetical protein